MTLIRAYVAMIFAVLSEVLATSLMKATFDMEYRIFGFLAMYILLVVSYYFMALSLKRLSISVAYAIWEVLGGLCVVLIGVFYFGDILSIYEKLGILFSLIGICLINYSEIRHTKEKQQ